MSLQVKILIVVLAIGMLGSLGFAIVKEPDQSALEQVRAELRECRAEADEVKEKNKQLRAALSQALTKPETLRVDDPELLRLVGRPAKQGGGGELSPQDVVKVVRGKRAAFQQCYERALKRNADLRALSLKLTLAFSVGQNGVPRDVRILPPVDETMVACMAQEVRSWRFPPYGGEPVTVEIPVPLVPKE